MLAMEFVRKHVGAIAGTAVGGMLLWLITSAVTIQSTRGDYAGILFGKRVPLADFAKALDSVTRQALMQYGDDYRKRMPPSEMENRAWERLTFLAEARRKGIRVSDKEVVEEIAASPLFQGKDGRFDQQGYEGILKYSMGVTPRAFEEETRENISIGKLVRGITGKAEVSEPEIQEAFQHQEGSIRVTVLSVPDERLAREIADAARQRPSWITQAAAQLGREPAFTPLFKRGDTVQGLSVSGSIFDPAFPLKPGEICPQPIPSGDNWLVVRLDEKQPADPAKLDDDARKKLQAQVEEQKKTRAYLGWYLDLLKRANPQKNPNLGR